MVARSRGVNFATTGNLDNILQPANRRHIAWKAVEDIEDWLGIKRVVTVTTLKFHSHKKYSEILEKEKKSMFKRAKN